MREIFVQFTTLTISASLCQQKAFWGAVLCIIAKFSFIIFVLHFCHVFHPWPCGTTVAEFCSCKSCLHEKLSWKPCLWQDVISPSLTLWIRVYLVYKLLIFFFHFRATQYTCMLLRYLLEPKAGKEKVVMKLKELESSVSTGRKCKYPVSCGTVAPGLDPQSL